MDKLILSLKDWHQKTFPDISLEEQQRIYVKKKQEFDIATTLQGKIEDLADVFIANVGVFRFDMKKYQENYEEVCKSLLSFNLSLTVLMTYVERRFNELEKN